MTLEDKVQSLLKSRQSAFRGDFRRPYLYHPIAREEVADDGKMEMNAARDRIRFSLPAEAGLIKCSAHVEKGIYELAVHFPDVFRDRYADEVSRFEAETGWSLIVRDTPHQARLFEEALNRVPEGATSRKAPALRIERKEVLLQVAVAPETRDGWVEVARKASEAYKELTGYTLVLSDVSGPRKAQESRAPAGALEINKA